MKIRAKSDDKMEVDDQKYISALMYMIQIVDVFSDFAFAFQCRSYWQHLEGLDYEVGVEPEVFRDLYTFALLFVAVPYVMNLISSIDITRRIVDNESMTEHSKQYFRGKTKVYAVLVLVSGGAFPALKLMSSNMFGLGMFSAGLSTLQLGSFRSHHVVATVLIENVPQLYLQYLFMFRLDVINTIVIVSFLSSIFNILLAMMNAAVFLILHRNQVDIPFTIMISWRMKTPSGIQQELDPFAQCGKRKNLAKLLGEIDLGDDEPLKFEILSSNKMTTGCLLHGVMASNREGAAQISGGKFSDFMARKRQIDDAVMRAFGFDQQYRSQFAFKISISRMTATSRAERVKLAIQTLREFKVGKDVISEAQQQMDTQLYRSRSVTYDDRRTSGLNEGTNQNTMNDVEMAVMGTAGATDRAVGNEDDISTENTLMGLINQGISVSTIRDLLERVEHRIESERMKEDEANLERIWEDDVNEEPMPMTTAGHLNVVSQSSVDVVVEDDDENAL